MPTYTYECAAGVEFDHEQSIKAPPLTECPICSKCTPKRLVSGGTKFVLLGGGWADQGYSK